MSGRTVTIEGGVGRGSPLEKWIVARAIKSSDNEEEDGGPTHRRHFSAMGLFQQSCGRSNSGARLWEVSDLVSLLEAAESKKAA